jgi:hypothetical protein
MKSEARGTAISVFVFNKQQINTCPVWLCFGILVFNKIRYREIQVEFNITDENSYI